MSKKLLQVRSIKNSDHLQMFESKPIIGARIISLEHTDASKAKVTEVISFKSNGFIDEHNYQDVVFESLYFYYYVKTKSLFETAVQIDLTMAKVALEFVSKGKLYHLHETTFYFEDFPLDGLTDEYQQLVKLVNSGEYHFALSVNNYEGDLVLYFCNRNQDEMTIKKLIKIPRYSMSLDSIYSFISLRCVITATPISIFQNLTNDIL